LETALTAQNPSNGGGDGERSHYVPDNVAR